MSARFPHPLVLSDVARMLGARITRGEPSLSLVALATLAGAAPDELSFYAFATHRAQARATRAGAVICAGAHADDVPAASALLLVDDAYAAYAHVAQWIAAARDAIAPGVHASASVAADASLGEGVSVGAHAVIEAGAVVGAHASIGAGCYVGAQARIGAHTRLAARVTLHRECAIGARGLVHSGTVIGADGFGFAPEGGRWRKIPQLGRVLIGDDVEIGANCAIDRGALEDTVIGDGCKLDNLIQVGHNVRIGEHCAIAGCTGIAGSAVIGRRCRIGGAAGILGHLEICDDVTISAMSLVTRSITRPGFYSGIFPLMDNADWERAAAVLRRLPDLRERVRRLERTDKGYDT